MLREHTESENVTKTTNEGINEGINKSQKIVWDYIKAHANCSVPTIVAATGMSHKSVERHISILIDKKLIKHRGSKKTGGYYTTE